MSQVYPTTILTRADDRVMPIETKRTLGLYRNCATRHSKGGDVHVKEVKGWTMTSIYGK